MRYPNSRYGNPIEFQYYAQGQPDSEIAKRLKRDKRTVQRWLNGKQKMPWWIPEILRLQRLEYDLWMHQTGLGRLRPKLGIASADVLTFTDFRPPPALPATVITKADHGDKAEFGRIAHINVRHRAALLIDTNNARPDRAQQVV